VLELSLREAIRLKHKEISAEHILLGLLHEGRGLAAAILAEAGVDFADLRHRTETSLRAAA
jgi:ATP-dependent Clp protease ATP-binding subunit ClpA